MSGQGPLSTAGLSTAEGAAAFFSAFPAIVLVANSDAVDLRSLKGTYGPDALFVFFNKVYKVLDRPFEGSCILVARSGPAGANIVYRREVGDVLRLVNGPGFRGILNIRGGAGEAFSDKAAFGFEKVGHLDLAPSVAGFYPSTHVPTSGFALALFLSERCPGSRVALAGFTARRSTKWKLFEDHDWTFEQIVLRLLFRTGRLEVAPGSPGAADNPLAAIVDRFDGVTAAEVGLVANEVLAERLSVANAAIDRLLRLTRLQDRFDGWLKGLKPKTRKAKLAEDAAKNA